MRPAIGLLTLAAVLFVPTAAEAAPSSAAVSSDGLLDVLANGGDTTPHTINVSFFGSSYLVSDTAGITAGAGCTSLGANSVSCPDNEGPVVQGGAANDQITIASLGPMAGASGQFTSATGIFAGAGNDTIIGSPLRDLIRAGDGDDLIDGGLGGDNIGGQRGSDTLTYASRPASQPIYFKAQRDIDGISPGAGAFGGAEGDSTDVDNVTGTPGNDTIIGFNSRTEIYDNGPANIFKGGAGNDLLSGLEGADRLLGEGGNDKVLGGSEKDSMNGGTGRDRCNGGASKDKAKKCEVKRRVP